MKLRAHFPRLQLIFLLGSSLSLISPPSADADVVIPVVGPRQEVRVIGVTGASLQIQRPEGIIGLPLVTIKEVQMAAPPEYALAQKAFAAKDYAKAVLLTRSITDKFRGVPVDWAQQASGMLGDLYIATNELPKAEAAYKEFQRLYPTAGSIQADVGMARIAVSKKDYAFAKRKLEPVRELALKEKSVTRANASAYSNAFLAMGEIKEKEGDLSGALEDYLRTVAIFYHDPAAVSVAQERADVLRSNKVKVP
jgi:tetratricopeptide (TPR) repeat protein